jgi:hypothetical protein
MSTYLDHLFREAQQEEYETAGKVVSAGSWLASLPLVLCGPIVRKVHYDNVSVWLAFKEEVTDIRLDVFDAISPSTRLLSGTVSKPLKLGKNLFITLVTATSTGLRLSANRVHGYDVSFNHGGARKQFKTPGVLKGGIESISYFPFKFPTFCLPADKLADLKIVHGSCRKPHGGTTDALRALDTMLQVNSANVTQRPQLLFLTGDQIYADDVSDILLYKINKAETQLLGWQETLPKVYSASQLRHGNRKDIIAKTGNKNIWKGFGARKITPDDLTTTDADSHLIFFSEFLLMYLFTFSDVLWSDGMPSCLEMYPECRQPKNNTEARAYVGKLVPYQNQLLRLNSFVKSLPYVRKALANTSVLMIFDDHDITDDWFITREWSEVALLKGTTSRRYILNGLLAYALFQDWGNNPPKYALGDGARILDHLNLSNRNNYLSSVHLRANPYASALESTVLPLVKDDRKNPKEPSSYLVNRIRWDYRIDYNSFNLFVLNTRTERQYFDKEKPLGNLVRLINTSGQFNPEKLAVVVSAAPVFGNIPMETKQDQVREGKTDLVTGAAARYADLIGMFEKDQEAWSFSGRGFGKLLNFLSGFRRVLILSGDVHYAFTADVKLWRKTGPDKYQLTRIVQSTSSALKNSTSKTHYPANGNYGLEPNASSTYKRIKVVGRTKPGQRFEEFNNPRFDDPQDYNPDRTRVRLDSVKVDPSLQFSVKFVRSAGYSVAGPLATGIQGSAQAQTFTDRPTIISPVSQTVVGKDNLVSISFAPSSIVTSIWLANGIKEDSDPKEADRLLYPYVKHSVDLSSGTGLSDLPVREFDKIRERMAVRSELFIPPRHNHAILR